MTPGPAGLRRILSLSFQLSVGLCPVNEAPFQHSCSRIQVRVGVPRATPEGLWSGVSAKTQLCAVSLRTSVVACWPSGILPLAVSSRSPRVPCHTLRGGCKGGCRRVLQAWWASGPGWGAGRWGEGYVQLCLPSH